MRIEFASGEKFEIKNRGVKRGTLDASRAWESFTIESDVETVKALFCDGAVYHKAWETTTAAVDENGESVETVETLTKDLSEYCVPGDVIDHRDGTVTVYMGKKTELELVTEEKAELVALIDTIPHEDYPETEPQEGYRWTKQYSKERSRIVWGEVADKRRH